MDIKVETQQIWSKIDWFTANHELFHEIKSVHDRMLHEQIFDGFSDDLFMEVEEVLDEQRSK
jgi:hypothetical protein